MNIAALYEEYLENDIVKFFREKQAISEESAITPDVSELTNKTRYGSHIKFQRYKFLTRVLGTEKYYLNEATYKKQTQIKLSILIVFGLAVLIVCIMIFSGMFRLLG